MNHFNSITFFQFFLFNSKNVSIFTRFHPFFFLLFHPFHFILHCTQPRLIEFKFTKLADYFYKFTLFLYRSHRYLQRRLTIKPYIASHRAINGEKYQLTILTRNKHVRHKPRLQLESTLPRKINNIHGCCTPYIHFHASPIRVSRISPIMHA